MASGLFRVYRPPKTETHTLNSKPYTKPGISLGTSTSKSEPGIRRILEINPQRDSKSELQINRHPTRV